MPPMGGAPLDPTQVLVLVDYVWSLNHRTEGEAGFPASEQSPRAKADWSQAVSRSVPLPIAARVNHLPQSLRGCGALDSLSSDQ